MSLAKLMGPRYEESFERGQAVVKCYMLSQCLHTARVDGLTKRAMADARRECKARVKYLLGQARA